VDISRIRTICFVCQWNEGRSAHLELSTRHRLRRKGSGIQVISAGLNQGFGINPLRREFLLGRGVPLEEIEAHRSERFGQEHVGADLVLVAELWMKDELIGEWPELRGKIMTVIGFIRGYEPGDESISAEEAHIVDTAGYTDEEKLALYAELEKLAEQVARRLTSNGT
jgi:protein-tyrosine-phosphatase